jgi:integrase
MRGHIRKRGKSSWSIIIDLGRDESGKRKQKWHTVKGKKSEAEAELRRLLNDLDEGVYVEPRKLTTKEYLEQWLEIIKPLVSLKTYTRYEQIVNKHLSPALGHHLLYKLNSLYP